jgi:hypothetical protein
MRHKRDKLIEGNGKDKRATPIGWNHDWSLVAWTDHDDRR